MFADVQVDPERGIGTCLFVNGYGDVSEANSYLLRLLSGVDVDRTALAAVRSAPMTHADDAQLRALRRSLPLVQPVDADPPRLQQQRRATAPGRPGRPESASHTARVSGTRFHVDHPDSPDVVDVRRLRWTAGTSAWSCRAASTDAPDATRRWSGAGRAAAPITVMIVEAGPRAWSPRRRSASISSLRETETPHRPRTTSTDAPIDTASRLRCGA